MRILLTNDDGIHAPGLAVLERIARKIADDGDIWVVAPETDQSGFAHSLTLNEPLRLRKIKERKFALKGTPTDCVIMGARELMPQMPELVLSGVNAGQNAGDDVTYSGTVAGAMEGALLEVKSIALSQAFAWHEGRNVPWETAEHHAPGIIERLCKVDFPARTLVNVNFPSCGPEEVAGTEITSQASFIHGLTMDKRRDGRGIPYYWIRFGREAREVGADADVRALGQRQISVTPLNLDLTHRPFMETLARDW